MTQERLDDLRRTPRQADVEDVEDLVSEVDRLHELTSNLECDVTFWKERAQKIENDLRTEITRLSYGLGKIKDVGTLHYKEGRECGRLADQLLNGASLADYQFEEG